MTTPQNLPELRSRAYTHMRLSREAAADASRAATACFIAESWPDFARFHVNSTWDFQDATSRHTVTVTELQGHDGTKYTDDTVPTGLITEISNCFRVNGTGWTGTFDIAAEVAKADSLTAQHERGSS